MWRWRQRVEGYGKSCRQPPNARRDPRKRFSLTASPGDQPCQHLDYWVLTNRKPKQPARKHPCSSFLPWTVPWCGFFLHSFQGSLNVYLSHLPSSLHSLFPVHCGGQHCNNTIWHCFVFSQLDIKSVRFYNLLNSPKKWASIHYTDITLIIWDNSVTH